MYRKTSIVFFVLFTLFIISIAIYSSLDMVIDSQYEGILYNTYQEDNDAIIKHVNIILKGKLKRNIINENQIKATIIIDNESYGVSNTLHFNQLDGLRSKLNGRQYLLFNHEGTIYLRLSRDFEVLWGNYKYNEEKVLIAAPAKDRDEAIELSKMFFNLD